MHRWQRAGRGIVAAAVVLGAYPLAFNAPAHAAPTQPSTSTHSVSGVTISPPLREVTLGPGILEAQAPVNVTNTTGKQLQATVQLVDFKSLDEYGGVTLENVGAPATEYSLAPWMRLAGSSSVTLPDNKSVTIPVTITNTSDLAPGGHYGAVVLSIASDTGSGENSVGLKQQLVSLIFAKKLGGDVYGLKLQSMDISKTYGTPEDVVLRFTSTGNVHVVPRGYVEVTDPKGKLVAKGIIDPESTIILPGTTRQFVTLLQTVSTSNLGGKYKVTAYYRYDGQDSFMKKTIYYTHGIAPIKIVFGGIVILMILCSGGWYVARTWRRSRRATP